MLNSKIKRQAVALLEMSRRVNEYPEEAKRAETHLARLQEEHCFTVDDIDPEAVEERPFTYANNEEKEILTNVYSMVANRRMYREYKNKKKLLFKTTAKQKIEIDRLFRAYKAKFKEERKTLLSAFMQKHQLWSKEDKYVDASDSCDKPEREPLTSEERRKLFDMMNGLDSVSVRAEIGSI